MIPITFRAPAAFTIDLQTYGYDDYFTQMTAKVSGGQAPDVFELDYQNFVSYAKKGALMPLDDILTKDGIDTSIYNDMALKAFSADGVQYGVPDSFSNVVLIYNKDLFDQAGIDYPTDDWKWEDAMAAAEKIRALGDNIFGYYHPISFNEFYKTVKAEFYKQMSNLTKQGKCILMISSDMPELISMSDRVLVVRDGRIDCELKGEQINEQEIIKRALGVNKDG